MTKKIWHLHWSELHKTFYRTEKDGEVQKVINDRWIKTTYTLKETKALDLTDLGLF